ncbi:EamA family transporter [Planomonospora corallina]|uniref:EamA family transporter n=1 Tax=Planomonospora corallina TaxID=1806052 RepID=A0ABV8IB80_9ACTN
MTAVLLATASALVYGTADFFGGIATRRSRVLAVVALSQLAGLVLVVAALPLLPGALTVRAVAWGMAAGIAGAAALVLFYRALATGVMSVVAPVTAATSAALPVLFGLAAGERPEPMALGGIALALAAVVMVSRDSSAPAATGGRGYGPVLAALAAGAGFGCFFVLLAQSPGDSGMWPLAGARVASVTLIALLAVATRRTLRPGNGRALPIIITAGALDMAANILFVLAEQRGMIALVGVLASLYPASTLVLARYVLGERLNAVQTAGIGVTLAAVALIAAA